ncbi:rRNA methylase, putative, group 3 [secondary endosymbiont of Heteropsylla cubana]|uniref:23S rRNA (guanosine-2'-O-)-methyltransferase RlmB n=1 Tax=secondary endosymbiont of Heteropsylla cubana TaxID=134287 RepID=J3TGH1_9ENTR|nr:23S rRNA (guanosine(2251)-2'-O)-methyltransferase RlmB [secondary endosymbiont of Heteropsylla cubana]AFP85532.1 rRNA methylase, putative, group 3 [secondary endosymbiont of Heteropsylla cubana]
MNEIIYGVHSVETLLIYAPHRILDLYLLKDHDNRRFYKLIEPLRKKGISIYIVNRQFLDKKAKGGLHQGIIALVQKPRKYKEKDLIDLLENKPKLLLVLDNVTDPHNLGACLRTADAAGVQAVIIPNNRTAPLNPIAKKVASGAAETIPLIRVINLARTLRLLKAYNIWVVGTTTESDKYFYQTKLTQPLAVVMGSEGKGIRRLTQEHCSELISIPMSGALSSLNVSVAAGICLFEVIRQRNSIIIQNS